MRLNRGDMLIIDNRRTAHARSPFSARFDGSDRWIQRAFAITNPNLRRAAGQAQPRIRPGDRTMNATYLAFAAAVALLIASPDRWSPGGGRRPPPLAAVDHPRRRRVGADPDDRRAGDDLPALDLDPLVLEAGQILGGLYPIWLQTASAAAAAKPPRRAAARRTTSGGPWRWACPIQSDILFFLAFLPGFILPAQPFARRPRS